MIQVTSQSPFVVGSLLWSPTDDGTKVLTIVAKATYLLKPDLSPLADEQERIFESDSHWENGENTSLRVATDLTPFKPTTEVLVIGHAFAPEKTPVTSLIARLSVGGISKTITVYGDRIYLPSGDLSRPRKFTTMPLRWERASGGPGTRNPVGIARRIEQHTASLRPAPNFQPPGMYVASVRDDIPPVGFGPVAPTWPERLNKLGQQSRTWDHRNWHKKPLPKGFDMSFFNCAPSDQCTPEVSPDESILLENLHPDYSLLSTRLTGVVPRAIWKRPDRKDREVKFRCDTLTIDTDRGLCFVVWRAQIQLQKSTVLGEIIVTDEGPPSLNFPAIPSEAEIEERAPVPEQPADDKMQRAQREAAALAIGDTLPIIPTKAEWLSNPQTATATAPLIQLIPAKDVPFATAPLEPLPYPSIDLRPPTVELPLPIVDTAERPSIISAEPLPNANSSPNALPTFMRAVREEGECLIEARAENYRKQAEPIAPPNPDSDAATPTAPPFVGPLAHAVEPPPKPAEPTVDHAPPQSVSSTNPQERSLPEFDPATLTLDQWAETTAELHKELPRKDILGRRDLSESGFLAADRHWTKTLATEAESGGFQLRAQYDAAYVRTLEHLRNRPLEVHEVAEIMAGTGQKSSATLLQKLELPPSSRLPIVRLWTGKFARDSKLSLEALTHITSLREGTKNA